MKKKTIFLKLQETKDSFALKLTRAEETQQQFPMENHQAILTRIESIFKCIPGTGLLLSYIKRSYRNDPYRIALELFLFFFAMKYLLKKKTKSQQIHLSHEVITHSFLSAKIYLDKL